MGCYKSIAITLHPHPSLGDDIVCGETGAI